MSIYRRVLRYYRPFLGQTILGLFVSLVGVGLNLLKPWPFKLIVDDFLRRPRRCAVIGASGSLALCCPHRDQVFWGMMNWITNYLFVKIGLQALLKLRTDLYSFCNLSRSNSTMRPFRRFQFPRRVRFAINQTIYNKGFTNIFAS
jgi:ATP-binding cassette subfamily B protein/subfamily B ATP-binding cassette protein MsbA